MCILYMFLSSFVFIICVRMFGYYVYIPYIYSHLMHDAFTQ